MRDLAQCREEIDRIDNDILKLLRQRRDVATDIAEYKLKHNQSVTDSKREQEKIKKLMAMAKELGLPASDSAEVFKSIIQSTVSYEQNYIVTKVNEGGLVRDTSVAYLGTIGTYSHLAARRYLDNFQGKISEISCQTFDEVIANVESGSTEYGMLPVENSSSGSINEVLDVLQGSKVSIVGELFFPIDHSILGPETIDLNEITDIYSHPQPVTQCSLYLKDFLPKVKIHYMKSSSHALTEVAKINDPHHVAIASHHAGSYYGLTPLMDNIANNTHNYTRFICVSMTPVRVPDTIEAKTSLSFTVQKYIPGSLMKVLDEFSDRSINILKIISRPSLTPGHETWEEIFFCDVQGNLGSALMQDILENIRDYASAVKVLGCYPSSENRTAQH